MSHPIPEDVQRLADRLRILADEIESAARYGVPIPYCVTASGHTFGGASFAASEDEFDAWVDYTFGGDETARGEDYEHDGSRWSRAVVNVNGLPIEFFTRRADEQVPEGGVLMTRRYLVGDTVYPEAIIEAAGTDRDYAKLVAVIDPEDRAQVERLSNALDAAPMDADAVNEVQAALREFANPTPIKPDEPLGLGAVIEAAGVEHVRCPVGADDPAPWTSTKHGDCFAYADLSAVKVLNEGWSQ